MSVLLCTEPCTYTDIYTGLKGFMLLYLSDVAFFLTISHLAVKNIGMALVVDAYFSQFGKNGNYHIFSL